VWLRPRGGTAEAIRGDKPPSETVVREDQIRFAVDVVKGQKTGLFLDQRDNRRRVAALASGATVLNLFSYNGGFSIAAALAGARATTSVDIAGPAIASAKRSFELSQIDVRDHEFAAMDVFDFAAQARESGRRWEVVVCDPPSFAPSAKHRGRALAAYRRLAAACMQLVDSGGVVVFASCSSHVGDEDLLTVLSGAARSAGRRLRVRAIHGAATDHPVRPEFPEGRYLSAIFAATGS
jgi:23S rRNA (cytosine1962-C5)-methyltransferase